MSCFCENCSQKTNIYTIFGNLYIHIFIVCRPLRNVRRTNVSMLLNWIIIIIRIIYIIQWRVAWSFFVVIVANMYIYITIIYLVLLSVVLRCTRAYTHKPHTRPPSNAHLIVFGFWNRHDSFLCTCIYTYICSLQTYCTNIASSIFLNEQQGEQKNWHGNKHININIIRTCIYKILYEDFERFVLLHSSMYERT